jgi:hypothetical protein
VTKLEQAENESEHDEGVQEGVEPAYNLITGFDGTVYVGGRFTPPVRKPSLFEESGGSLRKVFEILKEAGKQFPE